MENLTLQSSFSFKFSSHCCSAENKYPVACCPQLVYFQKQVHKCTATKRLTISSNSNTCRLKETKQTFFHCKQVPFVAIVTIFDRRMGPFITVYIFKKIKQKPCTVSLKEEGGIIVLHTFFKTECNDCNNLASKFSVCIFLFG